MRAIAPETAKQLSELINDIRRDNGQARVDSNSLAQRSALHWLPISTDIRLPEAA
jgi:hypothetical protein